MRRLVQHALAGVGLAAVSVTAAVASLGSPVAQQRVEALPTVVSAAPVGPGGADAVRAADRAAQEADAARSAIHARAAADAARRRATVLADQSKLIASEQAKLIAARERAAARARAEQARVRAEQARVRTAQARARAAQARARAAQARAAAAAKAAQARAAARAAAKKTAQVPTVANQGYQSGSGDPRQIARQILQNKYGYGSDQYSCFNNIIIRESDWNVHATNASSGAYGIPQALPGSKMATVASDWQTNPATQIIWGIEYMKSRYGSPCGAWSFKSSHGWY